MKKLFRMEEWQSPGGMWHCAHTGSFPQEVDLWMIPGAEVVVTETASEEHIEPSALKVSEEEKNKAAAMLAAMQF